MRIGLTACAALAAAALLGFTPRQVFAADPSSPGAAGPPPAAAGATEHASTPVKQEAPARHAHAASDQPPGADQPHRGVPRQAHGVSAGPPPDLTAPPINHVMTPEQVQALISAPDAQGPEDVMVEEGRYQAPVPQGQIRALAWALMHPLEAWRIFTPVTDE